MIEDEVLNDPAIRRAYVNLSKGVIIRALMDGDSYFFTQEDSIWLDIINCASNYNLTNKFFLDVLNNEYRNHKDYEIFCLLTNFGFGDYCLFQKLWKRWHHKLLPHNQELEKIIKNLNKEEVVRKLNDIMEAQNE